MVREVQSRFTVIQI